MHIVLWILLCLLASIGAVHVLGWAICGFSRPQKAGRAYQVIALERDPELLEEQLRYEVQLLNWGAPGRHAALILLDTGLDEQCKQSCNDFLSEIGAAIICEPDELAQLLTSDCRR